MKKIKKLKASILVSTIMILSVILVTVLSVVFVSNVGRNASTSSNESLVAYQRAETGIEATLAVIVDGYSASPNGHSLLTTIGDLDQTDAWKNLGDCDGTTGKIIKQVGADKENFYTIQLMKRKDATSAETVNAACNDSTLKFSDIILVKSVGILPGKTQRALQADVPAPPKP